MSSSKQTKFSGTKAAGVSILALCLLAFSQLLALLIGNMLVAGGMSAVTGNIFTGILYVGLVLGGVFLICKKMLKIPMADFKIGKPDLYPFWIIAAFAMPLLVILIYQLFAGTWQQSTLEAETLKQLVAGSVAYLGGVFLICKKMLKIPMADFKIGKPDLYPFWIIAAFAMPLLVILIYQLFAGTWQQSTLEAETLKQLVAGSVAYLGLATGIVEETVFRGIIMSSVEYAWNRKIAVIAPSVLFGCLHIEEGMSIPGMIQVVIAGSLVGILFSLVTCYTGTIWYSALMHGIWNCLMIGGLIHIGSAADSAVWYNYVLDTDSFLLTGGDFGVESSVISIAAYLIFAVIAFLLLQKRKEA